MHNVFISYSSVDKEYADAICQSLEKAGIRCWYAPRNIEYGMVWEDAVVEAIQASKVFVLVFSKHSNASEQVRREVAQAGKAKCIMIPFVIDSTPMSAQLSYYLQSVHWLDTTDKPLELSLSLLTEMVRKKLLEAGVEIKSRENEVSTEDEDKPPIPQQKNRKWFLLGLAGWLIVVMLVGMMSLFSKKDAPSIPFTNFSDLGDYYYPYLDTQMFTQNKSMYFLKNEETGNINLCKTDSGRPVLQNLELSSEHERFTVLQGSEDSDVLYFTNLLENTVKIYNRATGEWIHQTGIALPVESDEWLYGPISSEQSISSGRDVVEDMFYLVFNDTQKQFTQIIRMKPDGSFQDTDISSYRINEVISGVDDSSGLHYLLVTDLDGKMQFLDVVNGTVPEYSQEAFQEICRKYLISSNGRVSPDKRYVLSEKQVSEEEYRLETWDIETGKKQTKIFKDQYAAHYGFTKDSQLLYYNKENNTLMRRNLEKEQETVVFDKAFFERNMDEMPYAFSYSNKLDLCFFCSVERDEKSEQYIEEQLVVTDLEGNILYRNAFPLKSDSGRYDFSDGNGWPYIRVGDSMLYYILNYDGLTENAVATLIHGVRHSVDENGEVVFTSVSGG